MSQYHFWKSMSIKKFEADIAKGIFKTDGSSEDAKALADFLKLPAIDALVQGHANALKHPPTPQGAALLRDGAVVQEPPKMTTKPFLEVCDFYLQEKKLDNTEKTLSEKKATYEEFARLYGGNPDFNGIGSEQAISFKSRMLSENLTALRINKKLSFLKDLFEYARNHKLYFQNNPFESIAISKKSKLRAQVQSYEEFSTEELKLIFETQQYKEYLDKPAYYWLPFLALYTGARIEELASLKFSQIVTADGITYFDITKAKNANSVRRVPFSNHILNSGFMAYLEKTKARNVDQVFPHLKDSANGYSKNVSRRFGQYLDLIKIKDPRKVFHSFRSTFINAMTNRGTHPAILMGIVGHYEQSKFDFSSPHFQTYQQAKPLRIMKEAIDRLDYSLTMQF